MDPVKKLRFPESIPLADWDLFRDRPENADVKFPWELGRCQHFLTLAQAWHITKDTKFAQEILDQIKDFDERNLPGIGVNWTCTMDVGIRAANWAIALDAIRHCDDLREEQVFDAYASLFAHGIFIRAHLENKYEITSNHFLSNIVGLHFVAALFHDLPTAQGWLQFCNKCLEREIDVQVLPDGADFESSIPYHRLVIELFLGSYRLGQHLGLPLSEHYAKILTKMVDYLIGVLCPNGEMPVLGDADDGRLLIATDYGTWNRKDPRHIIAPAAMSLGKHEWLEFAPEWGDWEAQWWGFDGASLICGDQLPGDSTGMYPEAGVVISRSRDNGRFLMATNPIVGTVGFGNHKNNEQLSFEYHDEGLPLIVDPGSYVYTSDFNARNMFRSTAYHNTIMIDGVEQNEFNPEWLFRMFEKANPKHDHYSDDGIISTYRGSHTGYVEMLEKGVTHSREFIHDSSTGELNLKDELTGTGKHDLVWHFHFHPTVTPKIEKVTKTGGSAWIESGGQKWLINWSGAKLKPEIIQTWNSPSYGVRNPSSALKLSKSGVTVKKNIWKFGIRKK